MASVLGTLAALTVIGLLFALDPGGAIAQTGFPDYQDMDWKQLPPAGRTTPKTDTDCTGQGPAQTPVPYQLSIRLLNRMRVSL